MTTSNVQISPSEQAAPATSGGCGCGGCGCGQAVEPELDIHAIPRQVRHGAVLGALASLPVGESLVLVAPHEPRRLLAQVDATFPQAFEVGVASATPEEYRVRFVRRA